MDVVSNKALLQIYEILEGTSNKKSSRIIQTFIMTLISVNVFMVILETEQSVQQYLSLFYYFEVFSVIVFTVEYAARLISYRHNPKYRNSKYGLARMLVSPMMLADLAAILPFFLPFIIADARFIRVIRLFRLLRLFRSAKYSRSIQMLGEVIKSKAHDLGVAFFILFIVLIFSSSLLYYLEHDAQPEVFSSIAVSMWWGIITLTTIGYGDMYPVTSAGKAVASGIAVLGIAVYAIPTGIVASAFTEEMRKKRYKDNKCPYCGRPNE